MQSQSTVVDHWTEIRRTTKEWLDLFPLSNTKPRISESCTIVLALGNSYKLTVIPGVISLARGFFFC